MAQLPTPRARLPPSGKVNKYISCWLLLFFHSGVEVAGSRPRERSPGPAAAAPTAPAWPQPRGSPHTGRGGKRRQPWGCGQLGAWGPTPHPQHKPEELPARGGQWGCGKGPGSGSQGPGRAAAQGLPAFPGARARDGVRCPLQPHTRSQCVCVCACRCAHVRVGPLSPTHGTALGGRRRGGPSTQGPSLPPPPLPPGPHGPLPLPPLARPAACCLLGSSPPGGACGLQSPMVQTERFPFPILGAVRTLTWTLAQRGSDSVPPSVQSIACPFSD